MNLSFVYTFVLALFISTSALAQTSSKAVLGGDSSPAVLFNGAEISQEDLANFEASQIGDIRILSAAEAEKEFGKYGEHGVIVVTGKPAISADSRAISQTADEAMLEEVVETVTVVSKEPYIVIDGKPATNAEMEALASKIESVTVLKGEQARAKYGEKGADGVIEVVTKG